MLQSPLIRMLYFTTEAVYDTVMRIVPKPSTVAEGAPRRVKYAERDFWDMAVQADQTTSRIVETVIAAYERAPLCPLPAELLYLVPVLSWKCLVMVFRHVLLRAAENRDFIFNITWLYRKHTTPETPPDAPLPENELFRIDVICRALGIRQTFTDRLSASTDL